MVIQRRHRENDKLNFQIQEYKGIPIQLIDRLYYNMKAKRFILNGTNQNVWIPNKHLEEDGTLKPGEDIDYVFRSHQNQLNLAGITQAIPGIKRAAKNVPVARGRNDAELAFVFGFSDPDPDYDDD